MFVSTRQFAATVMLAALSFGVRADPATHPSNIMAGRAVVHYGDLNIDSEQDAKIMLQRIERAAKKACGGHATFSSYTGTLDRTFEECRSEAIQRTVKQLGAPMVTRVYSQARPRESLHLSARGKGPPLTPCASRAVT
jgi:UrcA family protein